MFILSCISRGLGFWSLNHTSTNENSELKVFENIIFLAKYLVIDLMIYQELKYIGLFNLIDDRCQQYYNVLIILQ